jgi:hypothetical protein
MMRGAWHRPAGLLAAALLAVSSAAGEAPSWLQSCLVPAQPPWRPDSAAIQLLDSSQTRFLTSHRVLMTYRSARRVTHEEGLPHLQFLMPYNADTDRIVSAEGWIVPPDGKGVRSYGRGAFVDTILQRDLNLWDAERLLVFEGGGRVAMGGTAAWEVQVERDLGIANVDAQFAAPMETLRSVFEVIPAPGTKLEWFADTPRLRDPKAGAVGGSLRWELDRLPRLPEDVPPGFIPDLLRVSVRCVPADPAASRIETWENFSRAVAQIMDPSLDSGAAVKAQADALAAGRTARWDRIRALTGFVQKEIVYLSIAIDRTSVAGYRAHRAADVIRTRTGDCKDKATLLVSMLRAIGEDGHVVLLNAADPRYVREEWPSAQFNHAIVAIPADADTPAGWPVVDAGRLGRIVIFDPTDPTTPLGILTSPDQGGFGLVVDADRGVLVRLPVSDPKYDGMTCKIDAALDSQGRLAVKFDEVHSGIDAATWHLRRWRLTRERFELLLQRRIREESPLAGDLKWADDWDPVGAKYRLTLEFTVPTYGRDAGGGLVLLAPDMLLTGFGIPHWQGRKEGVCWLRTNATDEEIRLELPPGCSVEELPDPWSEDGKTFSCQLSYRIEGRTIVYQRSFRRSAACYGESDYHDLEGFYQRLSAAGRRPIILRRAAAESSRTPP